jgi:hypothetical protein
MRLSSASFSVRALPVVLSCMSRIHLPSVSSFAVALLALGLAACA